MHPDAGGTAPELTRIRTLLPLTSTSVMDSLLARDMMAYARGTVKKAEMRDWRDSIVGNELISRWSSARKTRGGCRVR